MLFRTPVLTPVRIGMACAVALAADALQILLGPLGWAFLDELIDIGAMLAVSLLIGFHPLLLPTFVVELVPVVDMLPTWTACVLAVTVLRKRKSSGPPSPPVPPSSTPQGSAPIIDI